MPHSIEHCINAIVEEGIDRIKRSNLCESPGRAGGLPHYELSKIAKYLRFQKYAQR